MNGPNKLECYITIGLEGLLGASALAFFDPFVSYEENEVLLIQLRIWRKRHCHPDPEQPSVNVIKRFYFANDSVENKLVCLQL